VFISSFDLSRFTATVRDVQIRYRRPAMTDVCAEASLDASTIARVKRQAEDAGKTSTKPPATNTMAVKPPVSCLLTRGVAQP
jgi:hypothetical protein